MVPQKYFSFKASDVISGNRKKYEKKLPYGRELCTDKASYDLCYVQKLKLKIK